MAFGYPSTIVGWLCCDYTNPATVTTDPADMRPAQNPPTSRGRTEHVIALLVTPDAVAFEVTVIAQIFGRPIPALAAVTGDSRSPYRVVLCGEQPRYRLPAGVDVGDLAPLETLRDADTVMIPGVEQPLSERGPALLEGLRAAHSRGARMVSFCGGAFVLGAAGLLDGRHATTHWVMAKEFRAAFPLAHLEVERLYVHDGSVHTSGGMFSVVDLCLRLMALDLGQAYANDVARLLVSAPQRPGGQARFMRDSIRVDEQPEPLSLRQWIGDHLHEHLTLGRLAERHHLSERSLVRKFREETGTSVFDWVARERVERAKALLETTDRPVTEIAMAVGFGSLESLRRNFEKLVGTTASGYRATFRAAPAPTVTPPER